MQFLGSLVFTLLLFLTTAVFGLIVLACAWLPIHARYAIPRAWARVLFAMLKLLCRLDYTVEGREHLPNEPFISIWKHSSTWDTIAQMLVVPPAAWIVKREVIWIPIVGWAVATFRPIAIDRSAGGSAVKQVVAQGRKRFAEGLGVLIYPEGTRNRTEESLKEFHNGAFKLAVETGKAILPAIILNTKKALPVNKTFFFWPTPMEVHFLPPIAVKNTDHVEELKQRSHELMSNYYATHNAS